MSRRTLAQILIEQNEAHRRAEADASGTTTPTGGLQPELWGLQYPEVMPYDSYNQAVHPSQSSSVATEQVPPACSGLDAVAQESILACIEQSSEKYGQDIRKWPASARASLAPTATLTLRLQFPLGFTRYEVQVPKFPFLAASSGYRATRVPEQDHLTLISPDGNLQIWAIQWIGAWLRHICNPHHNEAADIPIPDTSVSWHHALQLRMTAIELGLGAYIKHIEDAWLAKGIARQDLFDDGPIIFKTARKEPLEGGYDKTDRLLVALCNRRKKGLWKATSRRRIAGGGTRCFRRKSG